jgi:hypothetical protein
VSPVPVVSLGVHEGVGGELGGEHVGVGRQLVFQPTQGRALGVAGQAGGPAAAAVLVGEREVDGVVSGEGFGRLKQGLGG